MQVDQREVLGPALKGGGDDRKRLVQPALVEEQRRKIELQGAWDGLARLGVKRKRRGQIVAGDAELAEFARFIGGGKQVLQVGLGGFRDVLCHGIEQSDGLGSTMA